MTLAVTVWHLDLNPLAVACLALLGIIGIVYGPSWGKRRRRARVLRERHARVAEDHAWANRAADVELAGSLRWARHLEPVAHVYEPVEGTNLVAMDKVTHRAHHGAPVGVFDLARSLGHWPSAQDYRDSRS